MPEDFVARMRVLLIEGARGRISARLRGLALALAGLMEARALSLRSVALEGSGAEGAIRPSLAAGLIARAWPARVSVRGLIVAAGVAVTVTAVTLVIASVARSRRRSVSLVAEAPLKEPFVIPIVTEAEPVVSGPEAVGTAAEPAATAPEAVGTAPEAVGTAPDAGEAVGTNDDIERAHPSKAADVATEAG